MDVIKPPSVRTIVPHFGGNQVTIIESSVSQLQARLAQSRDSLKALVRRKLDLEDDIAVKANTLFIDETECMGMRKSINLQVY